MSRPKIVLLGMLTKIPVGGVSWLVQQYAVGFERLGYEPYYVEAHGRTPSMFMKNEDDDATALACAYLDTEMRRCGLHGRWAFHAVHDGGRVYGMSDTELRQLYAEAALIINLHGSTVPLPEHAAPGRLVYMGTDPVDVELELQRDDEQALAYLEPHVAFFTWGLNYGRRTCQLPYDPRFPAVASPPPVVVDLWDDARGPGGSYTTIGNWRQDYRDIEFRGELYRWSKHHEFLKILDLPSRSVAEFELALSSFAADDESLLREHGWQVRPGLEVSGDASSYRQYIRSSRGELTVAKDQNVRLRTGWFSERSATYLAAGRPVITQETGFSDVLPTGVGLLSFKDVEEAADAVAAVEGDYERHRRAAFDVARGYFNYDVVLGALLDHVGLRVASRRRRFGIGGQPFPQDLVLEPTDRRPLRLPAETIERVLSQPIPSGSSTGAPPVASVVMVTYDNLVVTRMAVESVLANTQTPYELLIVDNASSDGTADYLEALAARSDHVRVLLNVGFAAANNQAAAVASAPHVVLLNNDTIVPPGWLPALLAHLEDPAVGAVGPVTNRCGNEAEVGSGHRTYGQLVDHARELGQQRRGEAFEIPMLTMFCLAARTDTFREVGGLEESYGVGMFEDDDFSRALHDAGYRTHCALDVYVHHFGEASFGRLRDTGEWADVFNENRTRFEQRWSTTWRPHEKRGTPDYLSLVEQVRSAVAETVPPDEQVVVVTRGDDALVAGPAGRTSHFPATEHGAWKGDYPADGNEAVEALRDAVRRGAGFLVVPTIYSWWLAYYAEFRTHLEETAAIAYEDSSCTIFRLGDADRGALRV
jgi:GT2 family glycosyltransferase